MQNRTSIDLKKKQEPFAGFIECLKGLFEFAVFSFCREKKTEKFLLVKGCYGLGNRILFLLSAMIFARLSRRTLLIDWRDHCYSSEGKNAFDYFFPSQAVPLPEKIWNEMSVYPPVWRGNLEKTTYELFDSMGVGNTAETVLERGRASCAFDRLDREENVLVAFSTTFSTGILKYRFLFDGLLRFKKAGDIQRKMLASLQFSPQILDKINDYARQYFGKVTFGVHIRYTDNLQFCTPKSCYDYLNAYFVILDELVEKTPEAVIFLCTDNKKIIQAFEDRYGKIEVTPKWYPEGQDLGPLNFGLHHSPECKNREQHGVDALVDVGLLSRCDHLVHSTPSTFSLMAKLLADPRKTRFYPVKEPRRLKGEEGLEQSCQVSPEASLLNSPAFS